MKVLFDFLSVVLFYLAYQFYEFVPDKLVHSINSWLHVGLISGEKSNAIYFAILIGVAAAGLQTLFHWAMDGKPTKSHILAFFIFLILGGTTLFIRDPRFTKTGKLYTHLESGLVSVNHRLGNFLYICCYP